MQSKQKLNLFSFTMIVVGLVIGMGIFRVPASVAATSGTETIFFGDMLSLLISFFLFFFIAVQTSRQFQNPKLFYIMN